jgi:hypothetical protein
MRIILFLFAVYVIGSQSVWGQLTIRLSLDQNVYLSGEAVIAHVEISNLSGQTISLGSSPIGSDLVLNPTMELSSIDWAILT